MKVLAYLREPPPTAGAHPTAGSRHPVSGESGSGGLRLEEQEQALRMLCEQRGCELGASFIERRRGSQEGKAFLKLLERLEADPGVYGQVWIADLSLLAPTTKEVARRVLEVEHRGATVLAASHTVGDPLRLVLRSWASERGSSVRRRRIREGMERRAVLGRGLGRPPYGYRLGSDGRLQVIPQEEEVVQRIYRLYAEQGMGLRRIARQLGADGVLTKGKAPWSVIAVRDLLRNRVYLGTYRRFGVRIPGSFPALVTPGLFQATQERLSAQGKRGQHGPGSRSLLSGLLYCDSCRGRLAAVRRRGPAGAVDPAERRYYRCAPGPCPQGSQPLEGLEAAVREGLGRLASQGRSTPPQLPPEQRAAQQKVLQARLGRLERSFQGFLDRGASGELSLDAVRKLSREPLRLQRALQGQLARLEGKGSAQGSRKTLKKLVKSWDELAPAQRRDLLLEAVERVSVGPGGLTITLRE